MINRTAATHQVTEPRKTTPTRGWDIAIIGAACRLPGIESLEAFWKRARRGESFSTSASLGPMLRHLSPSSNQGQDLDTLWFLDTVQDAIHDAGLGSAVGDFGRVEVIMGRGTARPANAKRTSDREAAAILNLLRSLHPELTEDELSAIREEINASVGLKDDFEKPSSHESRFIDSLRITEPTYVIEAGPGSGLLAVEQACRSLLDHRVNLAIAGAVHLDGEGEPGEGVGIVVLKRLADAEQNGDRIDSVIQGIGVCSRQLKSHESMSTVLKDFRQTLRRAYRVSAIDPATIDLIVSGTGETERQASDTLFKHSAWRSKPWNEVDPHFGERSPVAGILDLTRASLAIRHRAIPAGTETASQLRGTPQASQPWIRDRLDHPRRAGVNVFSKSGLSLHAVLEEPARTHHAEASGLINEWDSEAILLDAPDRPTWIELAQALVGWLEGSSNLQVPIKDLAYTLNLGKNRLPFRVGMVVTSAADLRDRLKSVINKLIDPACRSIHDGRGTYFREEPLAKTPKVAFLFPGEGSQYAGMLADLAPYFPEILHSFETSDRIARERGHTQRPSEAIFQADPNTDSGLFSTVAAVNIVLSAQLGLYRLIKRLGIKPDAVAGHSSGEFLAMVAAGIFPADAELEDRLGRVGSIFETLDAEGSVPKAKLVAASAPRERIEPLLGDLELRDSITLAIDNCPHQVILAGRDHEVDRLIDALRESRILFEVLPFDRAYHTSQFETAIEPIREFFQHLPMRRPSTTIYSCLTASAMPADLGAIRKLAIDQWMAPVAFRSTVEEMYQQGIRVFVEVGVRGSLTGFVDDILRSKPHLAIASNLPRRSGMTQLNHLVANLHAEGIELRVDDFYTMRNPRTIDFSKDLPTPHAGHPIVLETPTITLPDAIIQRLRSRIAGPVAQTPPVEEIQAISAMERSEPDARADWSETAARVLGEQNAESLQLVEHLGEAEPRSSHSDASAFLAYLETMDEFLETQRAVLEAYLGNGPVIADEPASSHRRAGSDIIHDLPEHPLKLWPAEDEPEAPTERSQQQDEPENALDIEEILLDEVSRRTGYPREILAMDLDMESDLGIDSIKRVEILGELRNRAGLAEDLSFDRLSRCQTLGAIVAELAPVRKAKPALVKLNWPGEVVEWVPGERFVGKRQLDGSTDPMATEHTLGGRRISAVDPGLLGLPVVPFTVMVEYLAQAASVLEPGKVVVGFRDVQANRWISYESEPSTLEFQATRHRDQPGQVLVRIWDRGVPSKSAARSAKNDRPSVEGVVLLADRRPDSPQPWPYDPGDAGPCRFEAQELYDDQWLFHGPPLQALKRVGLSSPTAIEGSLVVLPRRALLPEHEWPTLHTDPIVLDAFTHLLGCWGLDKKAGEEGDLMFPLRMAKLDLFGEEPAEGSEIPCRIQVQEVSRHQVRVNAELVGPDGSTWTRIEGWEDWRFYWADRFRDVCRNPQGVLIGKPVEVEPRSDTLAAVWVEPPADMLKPIWGDVIEWIHLSPDERLAAEREWPRPRERNRQLLGKIAAKEGARRLWLSAGLDSVYPADLEIGRDPSGEPRIRSRVANDPKPMPKVAFTSVDGFGFGVASLDPAARLGVALETIGDQDHRVSTGESDWVVREIPGERERLEWIARIHAAKLAVSQIEPSRHGFNEPLNELARVDWSSGEVLIAPSRDPSTATGARPTFRVLTGRHGEHVWALTLGERIDLP